jgi:hypothetical protein
MEPQDHQVSSPGGGYSSPNNNQFQQFFNPHMNAEVSPATKSKFFSFTWKGISLWPIQFTAHIRQECRETARSFSGRFNWRARHLIHWFARVNSPFFGRRRNAERLKTTTARIFVFPFFKKKKALNLQPTQLFFILTITQSSVCCPYFTQ